MEEGVIIPPGTDLEFLGKQGMGNGVFLWFLRAFSERPTNKTCTLLWMAEEIVENVGFAGPANFNKFTGGLEGNSVFNDTPFFVWSGFCLLPHLSSSRGLHGRGRVD